MPIFVQQMGKVDLADPRAALKTMERQIRYIQDQLEYTLTNLDSTNVKELSTDETSITNNEGTVDFSGEIISLSGKNGEVFRAGYDSTQSRFLFEVKGRNGIQCIYLSSNGEMIVTKNTHLSVDSGVWT